MLWVSVGAVSFHDRVLLAASLELAARADSFDWNIWAISASTRGAAAVSSKRGLLGEAERSRRCVAFREERTEMEF